METAQERGVVQLQGRQAWPFHMMAATTSCCLDASSNNYSSSSSSSGSGSRSDCFVLGWEQLPPPFGGCFGVLSAADVHELLPLFADMESPLPAWSSAPAVVPPPEHDAAAVPEDLDDLLLNFWDASCYDGDVDAKQAQLDAFNSSCCVQLPHETSSSAAATTNTTSNSFFHYDDDPLSSIFSAGPKEPDEALFQAPAVEPLHSSSSSNCHGDPHASHASGPQVQSAAATPSAAARAPPPAPRTSSASASLKRSTREAESPECSQSGGKRRKAEPAAPAAARVVCPFALLKPDGLDGGATLADINARILMRPARPVRHPVGEFACAPRVSADQPGISGKAVSSFTRLHTPGRGTITIIRTRG